DELRTKYDPHEASVPASTHNDQVPIFSGNSAMQQFFGQREPVAHAPWERPGEDGWTRVAPEARTPSLRARLVLALGSRVGGEVALVLSGRRRSCYPHDVLQI